MRKQVQHYHDSSRWWFDVSCGTQTVTRMQTMVNTSEMMHAIMSSTTVCGSVWSMPYSTCISKQCVMQGRHARRQACKQAHTQHCQQLHSIIYSSYTCTTVQTAHKQFNVLHIITDDQALLHIHVVLQQHQTTCTILQYIIVKPN